MNKLWSASNTADHPRIRGEHCYDCCTLVHDAGSSPHTRGARVEPHAGLLSRRIIPAYAGSTPRPGRHALPAGDHPRIRGEHRSLSPEKIGSEGSSPHTRGARSPCWPCPRSAGIIPAYAGSTCGWRRSRDNLTDHPRIRGEHDGRGRQADAQTGSSPHTRGALRLAAVQGRWARIIPAYAGSTGGVVGRGLQVEDHPRIRGEHTPRRLTVSMMSGSSPHTRGARVEPHAGLLSRRIIPAYAGSTRRAPRRRPSGPDHPRIRGEHISPVAAGAWMSGSSPHTRGAPRRLSPRRPTNPDHPRIRGEHGTY